MEGSVEYNAVRFFSFRQAHSPAYSSESGVLYYVSDAGGSPQLWRTEGGRYHEQLTFLEGYVANPKPTGSGVVFQLDQKGSEEFKILGASAEGDVRWILNDENVIYRLGGATRSGVLVFSSNKRSVSCFDTYVLDGSGQKLIYRCDGTSHAEALSKDGRLALVSESVTNLDTRLFLVDVNSGSRKELLEHSEEALITHPQFGSDGRIYALTNLDHEFLQPVVVDPFSQSFKRLSQENWDAESLAVSRSGAAAYTRNVDGESYLYVVDQESPKPRLLSRFEGVISELEISDDASKLFATFSSYDTNPNIFLLKVNVTRARAVKITDASRGFLGKVVKPYKIRYVSFDGLKIPAYVYTPTTTKPAAGFPVVVYVHGGPESQKRTEYDGQIQFLVNRGYGVIVPNVRGSTGYGRRYTHLDDVGKRTDAVADLAYLVDWIRSSDTFDHSRVCIMGRSYGGYMVLAALAFYPHLWKCGVESVGIANFETFLRNTAPWRRKLREPEYGSLERDLQVLRKISPINRIDSMRAPLIVQHGVNDPRVPYSESLQIVQALKDKGVYAELVSFPDEGHMNMNVQNRVRWGLKVAEFLSKNL
ncbi:MAG: S9 family peptidase [Thermoprotei archaeon]